MEALKLRFAKFMSILPSIETIDKVFPDHNSGGKMADYLGLGRRVILEQKVITVDQTQKIQKEIDKLQGEDSYPLIGSVRIRRRVCSKTTILP